ncbi:MAG TPA: hypothetical protein VEI97_14410 [bacterium]|nr:hypothetical protein [bacterium]
MRAEHPDGTVAADVALVALQHALADLAGAEEGTAPLESLALLREELRRLRALLEWPSRAEPPQPEEVARGFLWWMRSGEHGRWYPLPSALVVVAGQVGTLSQSGDAGRFIPLSLSRRDRYRCHDGACRPAPLP